MRKLFLLIFTLLLFAGVGLANSNNFLAVQVYLGPELYTVATAASDPNGNEADAITGWTLLNLNGTGSNVFESQGATTDTGGYAFHVNSEDTPTNYAFANHPLNSVTSQYSLYKITFSARHIGSGGLWQVGLSDGTAAHCNLAAIELTSSDTAFTDYELIVEKTHAVQFYLYINEYSATNDGGVYVDNISVRKVQ